MPLLIFKKHKQVYVWGCETCAFAVRNPRLGESIGEYMAESRNAFDVHVCSDYEHEKQHLASRLVLVKSVVRSG